MNINLKNRRHVRRVVDLRWAAALAFAAAAFSACGSDPPERQAQGSDQHLENLADSVEDQERELQAQGSDEHLENLAEAGAQ